MRGLNKKITQIFILSKVMQSFRTTFLRRFVMFVIDPPLPDTHDVSSLGPQQSIRITIDK